MRSRNPSLFALILGMGLLGWPTNISAEEGRTAALSLLRNFGARPGAMGQAYTAVGGDVQSLGFNPANVATLPHPTFVATYLNGFVDDQSGVLNYAHPVSFGSLFVGVAYTDGGTIEIVHDATSGVDETKRAQQDVVGMAGFAVGRTWPVEIGVQAKAFRLELAEEATATGMAADAGFRWKTPIKQVALAAAVQNIGPDIKYEVEEETLPQTVRAGLAVDFDFNFSGAFDTSPYKMKLTADGVQTRDRASSFHGGLELKRSVTVMDAIGFAALRGGYNSGDKAATAGVGFLVRNFILDYAVNLYSEDINPSHRVTIGWEFSQPQKTGDQKRILRY